MFSPDSGKGGIVTSRLIKANVSRQSTGKSEFDAIESRRGDAFFQEVLCLSIVGLPSSQRSTSECLLFAARLTMTPWPQAIFRCTSTVMRRSPTISRRKATAWAGTGAWRPVSAPRDTGVFVAPAPAHTRGVGLRLSGYLRGPCRSLHRRADRLAGEVES